MERRRGESPVRDIPCYAMDANGTLTGTSWHVVVRHAAGGRSRPRMSLRRVVCAVTAAGLVLSGCGGSGSSAAGTSSRAAFRQAFVAAQPTLRSIAAGLVAATAAGEIGAGRSVTAKQATRRSALAAAAEQEASRLEQLAPPPRYNTELRALGSTLNAAAVDLGAMSTAVAGREAAAVTRAARSVRADAADVRSTEARVAGSLGLASGS